MSPLASPGQRALVAATAEQRRWVAWLHGREFVNYTPGADRTRHTFVIARPHRKTIPGPFDHVFPG